MKFKKIITLIILTILISTISTFISQAVLNNNQKSDTTMLEKTLKKAKEYYYNGEYNKSNILYLNSLDVEKIKQEEILKNIIVNLKELHKYKEVLTYYLKLKTLIPDKPSIDLEIAKIYYKINENDIAKNHLEILLSKKDILSRYHLSQTYYYLGNIYLEKEKYDNAVKYYEQGIKINPTLILNYNKLAQLYTIKASYEKAINYYQESLKYDSSQVHLYLNLAELYEKINNNKLAYKYYLISSNVGINIDKIQNKIYYYKKKFPEHNNDKKQKIKDDIKLYEIDNNFIDNKNIPLISIGLIDKTNNLFFKTKNEVIISQNEEFIKLNSRILELSFINNKLSLINNNNIIKTFSSKDDIYITTKNNDTIALFNVSYGKGYFWAGNEHRQYRGKMKIMPLKENYFRVINVVNIEDYLLSVVPSEMPAYWPEEALKAQSVAARTYALKHMGKYKEKGYDLCPTVKCAVYTGIIKENTKSSNAVKETMGEVMIYNGKLIDAVFSSNSGGYTENSFDIWGSEHPYLKNKSTMINFSNNFPLNPSEFYQWLTNEKKSYSNHENYSGINRYRWAKIIPIKLLENKYNINNIENVLVQSRTKGGSVKSIIIKGNKEIIIKDDYIRSALFGLRSNRFFIEYEYEENQELNNLIIYGAGWGHNVGLDQTAAAGMALSNKDYKDILTHFYTDIKIVKKY